MQSNVFISAIYVLEIHTNKIIMSTGSPDFVIVIKCCPKAVFLIGHL